MILDKKIFESHESEDVLKFPENQITIGKQTDDTREGINALLKISMEQFLDKYEDEIIGKIDQLDALKGTDYEFHWHSNPSQLSAVLESYPGTSVKDKLLNREKAYCEAVLHGLIRANRENPDKTLVVLWDFDGTIGYTPNFIKGRRIVRPSQLSLMKYINENFKNINHGTISGEKKIAKTLQADKKYPNSFTTDISPLFDKKLLFFCSFHSSPLKEISDQQEQDYQNGKETEPAETKYFSDAILLKYANQPNIRAKLQVAAYAQDIQPNSFVVIIDDGFDLYDNQETSRIVSVQDSKFN